MIYNQIGFAIKETHNGWESGRWMNGKCLVPCSVLRVLAVPVLNNNLAFLCGEFHFGCLKVILSRLPGPWVFSLGRRLKEDKRGFRPKILVIHRPLEGKWRFYQIPVASSPPALRRMLLLEPRGEGGKEEPFLAALGWVNYSTTCKPSTYFCPWWVSMWIMSWKWLLSES